MAGVEAITRFPGWEKEREGEEEKERVALSILTQAICTAGNAGHSVLRSTWLPAFTKLTATKMSVYCSSAEQDKLRDGPLQSNR